VILKKISQREETFHIKLKITETFKLKIIYSDKGLWLLIYTYH
jgi:hypothetical protein